MNHSKHDKHSSENTDRKFGNCKNRQKKERLQSA